MRINLRVLKRTLCTILGMAAYLSLASLCLFLSLTAVYAEEPSVELGPYEAIVNKDPFDPERGKNISPALVEEGDPKDRYQVYGTIIAGGIRQAFLKVTDPKSKSKRSTRHSRGRGQGKNLRTVTVGDLVDGWRVKEITDQGVMFEADGNMVRVGVFDVAKSERKATAPVALQTPQPKPQEISTPKPAPKKPSPPSPPATKKPVPPSPKGPRKESPKQAPAVPESKAKEKGTETRARPPFFAPPAGGGPNPFLDLLKKSRGE